MGGEPLEAMDGGVAGARGGQQQEAKNLYEVRPGEFSEPLRGSARTAAAPRNEPLKKTAGTFSRGSAWKPLRGIRFV